MWITLGFASKFKYWELFFIYLIAPENCTPNDVHRYSFVLYIEFKVKSFRNSYKMPIYGHKTLKIAILSLAFSGQCTRKMFLPPFHLVLGYKKRWVHGFTGKFVYPKEVDTSSGYFAWWYFGYIKIIHW